VTRADEVGMTGTTGLIILFVTFRWVDVGMGGGADGAANGGKS
jgi:hypothetical protein